MADVSAEPEASQPLMSRRSIEQADDHQEFANVVAKASQPGNFVWFLTFAAALSGLLFGYDTGVMSATLVSLDSDLGHSLSVGEKSLITSITSLTALLASPLSGPLSDALGRKPILIACDVLFVLGALLQAFAHSVGTMTLGRAVIGLAIGAASCLSPLYITEMSPSKWRGRLVTISTLMITGGQVVSYVIGWLLSSHVGGWRWMVGLGALPAAIQAVALLYMPESPRWLINARLIEKARQVLSKIYPDEPELVETTQHSIVDELKREQSMFRVQDSAFTRFQRVATSLWTVRANKRALGIACMLQAAQQLCGFNTLMYFSATIFAMSGFQNPTATALLIALTNFALTIVAFVAIDKIGRRKILLITIPFMSIGLLASALAFYHLDVSVLFSKPGSPTRTPSPIWSSLLLASFLLFVAAYAGGIGNVPWQQAELFPLTVRAVGSALATATNWSSNFVIGVTFLPMMQYLTPPVTMVVYALVCVVAYMGIFRYYPETKDMSLEEITRMLEGSSRPPDN